MSGNLSPLAGKSLANNRFNSYRPTNRPDLSHDSGHLRLAEIPALDGRSEPCGAALGFLCVLGGGREPSRFQPLKRLTIRETFCPPKPKLFDRATSHFASRATLGM